MQAPDTEKATMRERVQHTPVRHELESAAHTSASGTTGWECTTGWSARAHTTLHCKEKEGQARVNLIAVYLQESGTLSLRELGFKRAHHHHDRNRCCRQAIMTGNRTLCMLADPYKVLEHPRIHYKIMRTMLAYAHLV